LEHGDGDFGKPLSTGIELRLLEERGEFLHGSPIARAPRRREEVSKRPPIRAYAVFGLDGLPPRVQYTRRWPSR